MTVSASTGSGEPRTIGQTSWWRPAHKTCPVRTGSSARRTTCISSSTRTRRSSTRARPMPPIRRTRCSCASISAAWTVRSTPPARCSAIMTQAPTSILGNADDPKVTMATWADLKANAATFLGLKITDYDVGNVPVLNVDAYGNVIRGPHGFAEFKVTFADGTSGFVEGNAAATIGTHGTDPVTGKVYSAVAHRQRLHQRHGAERVAVRRPDRQAAAGRHQHRDRSGRPPAGGRNLRQRVAEHSLRRRRRARE